MLFSSINHADQFDNENYALSQLILLSQTNVATRNNILSEDLSPGVVTILEARDLEIASLNTVKDALMLVPGIDIPQFSLLGDEPIIRGVGGLLDEYSGRIRYMLNGNVLNDLFVSKSTQLLNIPIEQVERIEVIRGASSALYGEFSFIGTINVVTKKDSDLVYLKKGSFNSLALGVQNHFVSSNDLKVDVNFSLFETDGADLDSGNDLLHSFGQSAISNSPGRPNLAHEVTNGFITLTDTDWSLFVFLMDEKIGDGFGAGNALSYPQRHAFTYQTFGVEYKKSDHYLGWDLNYRVYAKYFQHDKNDLYIFPINSFGVYVDGVYGNSSETEQRLEGTFSMSKNWLKHLTLISVELSQSKSLDIYSEVNIDHNNSFPNGYALPLTELTAQENGYEDKKKSNKSVFISDQYSVNDDLIITSGVRYDNFNIVDNEWSPRLDASYQINKNHLIKGHVARGFRPPTLTELFLLYKNAGNENLESEQVKTVEITHIYRTQSILLNTTFYLAKIDGDIQFNDTSLKYENTLDLKTTGVELSFEYSPNYSLKFSGNVSLQDAVNETEGGHIIGSADKLANINLLYQPRAKYSHFLNIHYVGQRYRSQTDTRPALSSYDVVNYSFQVKDIYRSGLNLGLEVNNAFNEEYRNPANENTYFDDYPMPSRSYWLKLTAVF